VSSPSEIVTVRFSVNGMSCTACASAIENVLKSQQGVQDVAVSYTTSSLELTYNPSLTDFTSIRNLLQSMGYGIGSEKDETQDCRTDDTYRKLKKSVILTGIFTIPVFILSMFFMHHSLTPLLSGLLTLPVLGGSGRFFFIRSYRQLMHRSFTMDTLVSLSTGSAFIYSVYNLSAFYLSDHHGEHPVVYFESAVVIIFFVLLGKLMEERARSSATDSIRKLVELQVRKVHQMNGDKVIDIPLENVLPGDRLEVRPGEKIPVDGLILTGTTWIQQSLMTGEPLPVSKSTGDRVFAGTLNMDGRLEVIAENIGNETLLGQIILSVRHAISSKAPVEKITDRIAAYFVPAVIIISILTFIIHLLRGHETSQSFIYLLNVLIIACPCALGLATPTAVVAGIGLAAQHSILIKNATAIESLSKIQTLFIDKTGTLTTGIPVIHSEEILNKHLYNNDLRKKILGLVGNSDHPSSVALHKYLLTESEHYILPDELVIVPGKGISGLSGNDRILIGSKRHLSDNQVYTDIIPDVKGIWISVNGELVVRYLLYDEPRAEAEEAISKLKKRGIRVVVLSGDDRDTVAEVSARVGADEWHGGLLPGDKTKYVLDAQKAGVHAGMCGDGINDSETLAHAEPGISIAHGSSIAIDSSDVVLVYPDLRLLDKGIRISDVTLRAIGQNLIWAFLYNVLMIPIAGGVISGLEMSPMLAGGAMGLSSVGVVLNSLRIRYLV
jgi:Cu2+-exporting ATPase